MSAVSKESEDEAEAAGTSSMMESTMMEGEEYYNPDTTVAWSEKVSGGEQLCRICAGANEYLIPIFSGEGLEHQLGMKIEKHLPIQVLEQDKLPVQVCYQCASTLIAWHDLVVGCVEAEKKLRQLYQQENVEEEEEEDDFGDDDRTELFNDPVDSEMAEDPLEPSTSTSTATRSTRSPRKKTVTRAKPKLKMTLVKTPAALPKSPPKLLQPKEEQVEADPATERIQEMQHCNIDLPVADNTTPITLALVDHNYSLHHQTESRSVTYGSPACGALTADCNKEENVTHESKGDRVCATTIKTYHRRKAIKWKKRVAHIKCYALKKGHNNRVVHSSCSACGKEKIPNPELWMHVRFQCVLSKALSLKLNESTISLTVQKKSYVSVVDPLAPLDIKPQPEIPLWNSLPVRTVDSSQLINKPSVKLQLVNKTIVLDVQKKSYASAVDPLAPLGIQPQPEIPLWNSLPTSTVVSSQTINKPSVQLQSVNKMFYECPICRRNIRSKVLFNRHKLSHEAHKCKICNKYLITKSQRKNHYKKHEERPKNRTCLPCGKTFHTSNAFSFHKKSQHTEHNHACSVCDYKTYSAYLLKDHAKVHNVDRPRPYMCEICGLGFFTRGILTGHQETHNSDRPRPFICEVCGSGFHKQQSLKQHKLCHLEVMPYLCTLCGVGFARAQTFKQHEVFVHSKHPGNIAVFTCNICNQRCRNKIRFDDHMNLHTDERPYACNLCDKAFRNRHTLSQHIARHKASTVPAAFSCNDCEKTYKTSSDLNTHKNAAHGTKSLPFSCVECGRKFRSNAGVAVHYRIVHRQQTDQANDSSHYTCNYCGTILLSEVQLLLHMSSEHGDSNILPHSCKLCNKSYKNKQGLAHHIEAVHSDTQFPCKECNKVFESRGSLYQHRKLVHLRSSLEPLTCTTCGKVCYGKHSYDSHIVVHQEKTISCEVCGMMFRRHWDHQNHMRMHTGEKPYSCHICGLSFTHRSTRMKHIQNIHEERVVL